MSQETVYVRATADAVRRAITALPKSARAGGPLADAMLRRVGLAVLGRVRRAFVDKARGGADECGETWKPLSPRTVAYSVTRQRGKGGRTKAEKKRDARPSQALSAKQQAKWWEVYRKQLAIHKGDKGHAAAVAWLVLKAQGARTLVEKYGGRQVEVLRDTGLLLNSLSPGTNLPEQVLRVGRGEVVVGTNRRGARAHHTGIPGRLPQRRLWPEPSKWTASWWADISDQVKQGLMDMAVQAIKGNT